MAGCSATSRAEQIHLWDSSGKLLRTFGHEFGSIASLAFSPDGTLLASAGYDANVHFWDVSTGQRKTSVRPTSWCPPLPSRLPPTAEIW